MLSFVLLITFKMFSGPNASLGNPVSYGQFYVNTLNSCEGTKVASAFTCSRIRTLMAGLLIFVCLFF